MTHANNRILTRFPGKTKVALSLNSTIAQFVMSSSVPVSEKMVRDSLDIVCGSVPWFCRIIQLNGEGCGSINALERERIAHGGKENVVDNKLKKQVEGLLIFAKRDGEAVGQEQVLKEFRIKRLEWEKRID